MKRLDEIDDNELRVISGKDIPVPTDSHKKWLPWLIGVIALVSLAFVLKIVPWSDHNEIVQEVFEPENALSVIEEAPAPPPLLGDYSDTTGNAYTEIIKQIINDIPLVIYIPHNAKPILTVGTPDKNDKSIIFAAQAADIRADNKKINGAFVLAGTPLAWGLSKKGFVGIIDDHITVGVADNSPLFEEATEKGGYFFRQYPLVDNGKLVENEPKNKSVRKAICDRDGEIFIAVSENPESFHDFAQALVDLHVDNAVYLVGSDSSYGFYRDYAGELALFAEKGFKGQKYESYLVWLFDM